jgi:hypothetical protein
MHLNVESTPLKDGQAFEFVLHSVNELCGADPEQRTQQGPNTILLPHRHQRSERKPLRQLVMDIIQATPFPLTCEVVLDQLRAAGVSTTLSSVRARVSELSKGLGLITDSGLRGRGEGGRKAICWRIATAADHEDRAAPSQAMAKARELRRSEGGGA